MGESYLFYDIETTGLNKSFDQIIQFAAIRTDLDFNEIERYEVFVKISPDVIPSPISSIIHQISIKNICNSLNEYDAMKEIHKIINTPGTINIGYNNLNFDDQFLQFSFYRNLLTPYTHKYLNNCFCIDLFPITVMYYLFDRNVLSWPVINDQLSLKLEHISEKNSLSSEPMHNAMVDVQVTLSLAMIFAKKNYKMWQKITSCFQKNIDQQIYDNLPVILINNNKDSYRQAILIDGKLSENLLYQVPVISLGRHNYYKNQLLWLRLDLPQLRTCYLNDHDIKEKNLCVRKKLGSHPFLLEMNNENMIHLTENRLNEYKKNIAWLNKNIEILKRISDYHRNYRCTFKLDFDIYAALYAIDFWTPEENTVLRKFHSAAIKLKSQIATKITNKNTQNLAFRLLAKFFANFIPEKFCLEYKNYLDSIYKESKETPWDLQGNRHYTPQEALIYIQNMDKGKLDNIQIEIISELKDVLTEKIQYHTIPSFELSSENFLNKTPTSPTQFLSKENYAGIKRKITFEQYIDPIQKKYQTAKRKLDIN